MKTIEPFGACPYPSAMFLTPALKDTIRIFRGAIESRQGMVMLIGDVGYGKSSLLRFLHADYAAADEHDVVLILTPTFNTPFAFVKAVCEQLDIPAARSFYAQQTDLENYLVARYQQDRNVTVFLDEAQLLDRRKLETLRWLLNLESDYHKLIQFVVAGQIEFWSRITSKWNRALKSRVYSVRTLLSMTLDETLKMLEHRCDFAGISVPFDSSAIEQIYGYSNGVPRDILQIAHEAWKRRSECPTKLMTASFIEVVHKELRQAPKAEAVNA